MVRIRTVFRTEQMHIEHHAPEDRAWDKHGNEVPMDLPSFLRAVHRNRTLHRRHGCWYRITQEIQEASNGE